MKQLLHISDSVLVHIRLGLVDCLKCNSTNKGLSFKIAELPNRDESMEIDSNGDMTVCYYYSILGSLPNVTPPITTSLISTNKT